MRRSQLFPFLTLIILTFLGILGVAIIIGNKIQTNIDVKAPAISFLNDYYTFLFKVGPEFNYKIDDYVNSNIVKYTKEYIESDALSENPATYMNYLVNKLRPSVRDYIKYRILWPIQYTTGFVIKTNDDNIKVGYSDYIIKLLVELKEVKYNKGFSKSNIFYEPTAIGSLYLTRYYNLSHVIPSIKEIAFFLNPYHINQSNIIDYIAETCVNTDSETYGIEGCIFYYRSSHLYLRTTIVDIKKDRGIFSVHTEFKNNTEILYTKNVPYAFEFIARKAIKENICSLLSQTAYLIDNQIVCKYKDRIDDCYCRPPCLEVDIKNWVSGPEVRTQNVTIEYGLVVDPTFDLALKTVEFVNTTSNFSAVGNWTMLLPDELAFNITNISFYYKVLNFDSYNSTVSAAIELYMDRTKKYTIPITGEIGWQQVNISYTKPINARVLQLRIVTNVSCIANTTYCTGSSNVLMSKFVICNKIR